MRKGLESKATKIANVIRRTASELLGWAIPTWSPHNKEAYKDIPLGIAVIAIIFSLVVLVGLVFSFIGWIAQ